MKKTTIVDPWELCAFVEQKYKINNHEASTLVHYVTPECEVRTFHYTIHEVQEELDEIENDFDDKTDLVYIFEKQSRQLLLDFMIDNKLTEFTLTQ